MTPRDGIRLLAAGVDCKPSGEPAPGSVWTDGQGQSC